MLGSLMHLLLDAVLWSWDTLIKVGLEGFLMCVECLNVFANAFKGVIPKFRCLCARDWGLTIMIDGVVLLM